MHIILDNVSKHYGVRLALESTSLSFAEGMTTVLIGPSGCGKSTLLRLIIGLVAPDTGSVRIDGQGLRGDALLDFRRRTGYVIQEGGLFPHLTARENVSLMARELRWGPNDLTNRIAELLLLVRLDSDVLERFPVELSGGQRQRVGLMRALLLGPELLLLDEPLGALDPMVRFDLQRDLKEIFKQVRTTVVMVTHDLAEAAYLGDTIILMREGRIIQTGSIEELASSPSESFVRDFVTAQRARHEVIE